MELRHLRYFIAVAEAGSLTVAAEQRLRTAQPSLSRQMRDLEQEVGAMLLQRHARGIELTPAGRVFLDHARIALLQVEAAGEAARRAAQPPRANFAIGFLTGFEMEWMAPTLGLLQEALPTTELAITSQQSPDLAAGLMRGRLDVAFLRPEKHTPGLVYQVLRQEPLIVVLPAFHPLAAFDVIAPKDLAGHTYVGVPTSNSPALRAVIDAYASAMGVDLTPRHEALNLAMAISLVASTGGVSLLPYYARNLLPPTVVSRPLAGVPPMIGLALGYSETNTSPLLQLLLSKTEELKFRVDQTRATDRSQ
jgi:LysR family hca operon transcriptional activator